MNAMGLLDAAVLRSRLCKRGAGHTDHPACSAVRYLLDRVADNNRRYLVDSHIQAAPEIEALLEEPA